MAEVNTGSNQTNRRQGPKYAAALNTKEGADHAIGSDGRGLKIEEKMADVLQARQRLMISMISTASPQDRQAPAMFLTARFGTLVNISEHASEEALGLMPDSEFKALVMHAIQVFGPLSKAPAWTQTGVLQRFDEALLACINGFLRHKKNVKLAIDLQFFVTLAELIGGRCSNKGNQNQMPCLPVAQIVSWIIHRTVGSLSHEYGWQFHQIFVLLESTGMLAQILRCSTLPYTNPQTLQIHVMLLTALLQCPAVVQQKIVPGSTPSGDILQNIVVTQTDGYAGPEPKNPVIEARLKAVHAMAVAAASSSTPAAVIPSNSHPPLRPICQHCNSIGDTLVKLNLCARCKGVYYCSRDCQVKNWTKHKAVCIPKQQEVDSKGKEFEHDGAFAKHAVFRLIQTFYYQIMVEIHRVADKERLDKKDLLLEADFKVDGDVATTPPPALRNPPEFKIAPIVGYLDASSPESARSELPDWFGVGTPQYSHQAVESFCAQVKSNSNSLEEHELLTILRGPAGHPFIFRFAARTQRAQKPIFGREAYDLVGQFSKREVDKSALTAVFDPEMIRNMMLQRDPELQATMEQNKLKSSSSVGPNSTRQAAVGTEPMNQMMAQLKTEDGGNNKDGEDDGDYQEYYAYN